MQHGPHRPARRAAIHSRPTATETPGPGARLRRRGLSSYDIGKSALAPAGNDGFGDHSTATETRHKRGLAIRPSPHYVVRREVGAGRHLANPVRSGRKQP